MDKKHPGFRTFILGAGFSRSAGLPLANELYGKVKDNIESKYGDKTPFHRDLSTYIDYEKSCGREISEQEVDLEKFMSFLDIEHFLGFRACLVLFKPNML